MSLHAKLMQRAAEGRPLRIGLIGAGKFGAMYLAQIPKTPGVHLAAIADLAPVAARVNLERVGWKPEQFGAGSLDDALARGNTHLGDNWERLVSHPQLDIVVEATGNPVAAVEHCLAAFANGKHVVNVTVEADALCALPVPFAHPAHGTSAASQPEAMSPWVPDLCAISLRMRASREGRQHRVPVLDDTHGDAQRPVTLGDPTERDHL